MATTTLPILRSIAALRETVRGWRAAGDTIGFVPTMGALHDGHLSLARRARADNRRVVVSIFVNPTQFGPNEDFARYPRDLEGDSAKLATVGVDAVFAPEVSDMYPPGAATTVTVRGLTDSLCGPFRPGHFDGVATIVTKLLLQALPDAAYFGEKDYQQLQVVKQLTRDLDIPVRIVGVPTVREPDGLAMSSRNAFLSPAERKIAATLNRVLAHAASALSAGAAAAPIVARAKNEIVAGGFRSIDYVDVVDATTLKPLDRVTGPARIAAAVHLGTTRLIDNIAIN